MPLPDGSLGRENGFWYWDGYYFGIFIMDVVRCGRFGVFGDNCFYCLEGFGGFLVSWCVVGGRGCAVMVCGKAVQFSMFCGFV